MITLAKAWSDEEPTLSICLHFPLIKLNLTDVEVGN